ncbi:MULTISPECIES: AMP-binding protein [Protofrankia]|uniref:O-succinylbenzoate--CoA ligase n=1 Tax=Candidatus Protofrankia datiscae TaxID=2716812 RepID=F8B0K6_9ACTN|nr:MULTISPECIES: AMP-binding protein [Protofrankia]AEH09764.1 o-succinylbenzoate--CoA ligase [Candidatus Protofrankia datiscae]
MTSVTGWLGVHGREQPDQVYLREARGNRSVTYGTMAALVQRWQSDLDAHGPRPRGRIAILVSDPLDFAVVFLAILVSGRHAAPLDPDAPPAELERALARIHPALVVTDRPLPPACGVRQLNPRMTTRHTVTSPVSSPVSSSGHVASDGPTVGGTAADSATDGSGARHRTSGGVLLTGATDTAAATATREIFLDGGQLAHVAAAAARHHQLTRADIGYNPLPLVHVNAQVAGLLATLYSGGTLVLDRRFRRRGFWTMIKNHQVTWINGIPSIVALLAMDPHAAQARDCRLRFVRSASAPLPVPVLQAFEEATDVPVLETYGMAEAGSMITANPPRGARRPGSVGLPVGSEVRVVDDEARPCPPRQAGRVQIRGPGVIRAYAGPTGADSFTPDGWLDTGDIGFTDADGYLYLTGRGDDVINRGGEKVSPREIEEVLLADPRVRRAVVVGRPDAVLGEVPVALVVPVNGPDPLLVAELVERCEAGLARFKRPTSIEIVTDLPGGRSGPLRRPAVQAGISGSAAA